MSAFCAMAFPSLYRAFDVYTRLVHVITISAVNVYFSRATGSLHNLPNPVDPGETSRLSGARAGALRKKDHTSQSSDLGSFRGTWQLPCNEMTRVCEPWRFHSVHFTCGWLTRTHAWDVRAAISGSRLACGRIFPACPGSINGQIRDDVRTLGSPSFLDTGWQPSHSGGAKQDRLDRGPGRRTYTSHDQAKGATASLLNWKRWHRQGHDNVDLSACSHMPEASLPSIPPKPPTAPAMFAHRRQSLDLKPLPPPPPMMFEEKVESGYPRCVRGRGVGRVGPSLTKAPSFQQRRV